MFIYSLVDALFTFYRWVLIARILLSWMSYNPHHPVIKFIHRVTDPVLDPLSRMIPPIGMFDISPIIAFLLLNLVQKLVMGALLPYVG